MEKIILLKEKADTIPVSIEDSAKSVIEDKGELESVLSLTVLKTGGYRYYQGVDRKEGLLSGNEILWILEKFKQMVLNDDFD